MKDIMIEPNNIKVFWQEDGIYYYVIQDEENNYIKFPYHKDVRRHSILIRKGYKDCFYLYLLLDFGRKNWIMDNTIYIWFISKEDVMNLILQHT